MSDESPHNPRLGLPPVRMALRVKGRHGHKGGAHLARQVTEARAPKHLAASTRLTQHAAPPEPAAYAPAPEPAPYAMPPFVTETADAGLARSEMPARPDVPELSDFASEFLFGDAGSASAGLTPMSQAERLPETDTAKERRLARRRARGALDVSRAAKILEGPAAGPEGEEATSLPELAAPAGPVEFTGRPPDAPAAPAEPSVARTPADAPAAGEAVAPKKNVSRTPSASAPPPPP